MKFSLLTVSGRAALEPAADFAFFLHDPALIESSSFSLTPEEIELLNPNTEDLPVFRSRRDAEITLGIYRRVPVLVKEGDSDGNPWGVKFMTMFHMSNDSHLFRTREQLEGDGWRLAGNVFVRGNKKMLPLYEAKMIHNYDHRWATYDYSDVRDVSIDEKHRPDFVALPRYWVEDDQVTERTAKHSRTRWLASYRWITNVTNERTLISAATPPAGAGNSQPVLCARTPTHLILASWASFCVDYIARQKLGGQNMTFGTMHQIPVPPPKFFEKCTPWNSEDTVSAWITSRFIELSYTASDMKTFAEDLNDFAMPFQWNEDRRALIRAELDSAYFHLYAVDRDDAAYILDTFPILKRKDEAKCGEYRTKRLTLEMYDRMAEAMRTGKSYQTILNPPPGQGPRHPAKQEGQ